MSRQDVPPSRRGHSVVLYPILGIGAVLALAWVAYGFVLTVPVVVDGKPARLVAWTSVGDLREDKLVGGASGDLVAAKDKRVLKPGGGEGPFVTIGGKRAREDQRLRARDVVESVDGTDVVEPLATRTEQMKAPVRYEGEGSIETVVDKGAPGTREITYGSISKQVVATRVIRQPMAQLVKRTRPERGAKIVALTFDDGPWPGQTDAVLSVLKKYGVKATFFEVGSQARGRPEIAKKLADAGMMLANHSQTHANLAKCSPDRVRREITQANANIEKASGQRPRYFRPPGGNMTSTVRAVLDDVGLKLVQWDIDTGDWRRPGASAIANKVLSNVKPGAVVLMHDGGGDRRQTIDALPAIIEGLKAKGYSFVTLDALSDLPHRMG